MNNNLKFTDSHCHLDFNEFEHDLPTLLSQCSQANIHQIIIPTIGPTNWQKVVNLSVKSSNANLTLRPCLGIHPWFLNDLPAQSLHVLETVLIEHLPICCAIGEAGIDGVIAKEQNNMKQQHVFFEGQLQLAEKYQLPIVVHHRQSHQDILPLLKTYKLNKAGVIHAFSGSYQQACQYIDLGFKLGVGGTITYPRAQKTINTIKRLPLTSLVLETDAPAMPLYGFQGQVNSPMQLIKIFEQLCVIRNEDKTIIATTLEDNIKKLFFKS